MIMYFCMDSYIPFHNFVHAVNIVVITILIIIIIILLFQLCDQENNGQRGETICPISSS